MGSIGGIGAVQARIAALQARVSFAPSTSVNGPLSTEVSGPSSPTSGFDAFGSVYQDAMTAAGIVADSDSSGADASDNADSGAGSTTTPGGTGGTGTAPVYGTGVIAGFTPAEFATIDAGQADTGSTGSAGSAGSAGTIGIATTDASPGASVEQVQAAQQYAQTVQQQIGQISGDAPIYGTAASLDATTSAAMSGPVYTGASQRAQSQYSSYSPEVATYSGAAGTTVGKIGGYGAMPVPAELRAYGNGKVPAAALESIGQSGHRLDAPAAHAWTQAVSDAAAEGVTLRVTDSYRSYENQVELAGRKGLYRDGGYAATPGTSNHGWGLAIDIDVTNPAAMSWIREHGHDYGFVEAVPREPWHWEYRPQQA